MCIMLQSISDLSQCQVREDTNLSDNVIFNYLAPWEIVPQRALSNIAMKFDSYTSIDAKFLVFKWKGGDSWKAKEHDLIFAEHLLDQQNHNQVLQTFCKLLAVPAIIGRKLIYIVLLYF